MPIAFAYMYVDHAIEHNDVQSYILYKVLYSYIEEFKKYWKHFVNFAYILKHL